jgi:glycosyltransferase involved in cell wall biosynthesis
VRICLVSAALPDVPCGIGDYTDHLARGLTAAGVEIVVVTTDQPGLRTASAYEVRPVATRWLLGDTARVARAVGGARADLVHIQFPGSGYGRGFAVTTLAWALKAGHPRRPVAITLHEFDRLSRRHRLRVAAGALPCRLVVAPGTELAKAARRWIGWRPGTRVVEIPLASNVIPAQVSPAAYRRSAGELVVGYFGFLRPDKGVETLLEAFAKIRSERAARLVIAGDPGPDTDYAAAIRRSVDVRGLGPDTLFTGPLTPDGLSAALLGFDVCVLPFRDGLTANRGSYSAALAHGLPVVTTTMQPRGLDPARSTLYVAPGDVAALSQAIIEHGSAPHRPPSTATAREWEAIAARHVELYREILGR